MNPPMLGFLARPDDDTRALHSAPMDLKGRFRPPTFVVSSRRMLERVDEDPLRRLVDAAPRH